MYARIRRSLTMQMDGSGATRKREREREREGIWFMDAHAWTEITIGFLFGWWFAVYREDKGVG